MRKDAVMELQIVPKNVRGLGENEIEQLQKLLDVFKRHIPGNRAKSRYYEGKIPLNEVNLGIALPEGMRGLEIGCAWGAKTVDVLAGRSMFDGVVDTDGTNDEELNDIVVANNLVAEYPKACRDELKLGSSFATLSADKEIGCKIRFHSAQTAAGIWDGVKGRIGCGMAIIDVGEEQEKNATVYIPSLINLYTDDAIWVMRREGREWYAEKMPHKMGRPLMEPLIYNPTSAKPFGQSRIKEPVRRLIQGYVRTVANATIGLEFSTAPQKYLLGITDEQFDQVINQRFRQYVGSIIASTVNPETGEKPSFGQLQQGTITPHVEMLRMLATQFSAATGLTVTDTGVVNDANPTSSDAILAQSQTLVSMAEHLNQSNGDALRTIGLMALAIKNNVTMDDLTDSQKKIVAHFKNPAMPSVAVTADAAIKIAAAREGFAQTDTFLEMIGFGPADIRRIKAQEQLARGLDVLGQLEVEEG